MAFGTLMFPPYQPNINLALGMEAYLSYSCWDPTFYF
jgi:hypothetical protein